MRTLLLQLIQLPQQRRTACRFCPGQSYKRGRISREMMFLPSAFLVNSATLYDVDLTRLSHQRINPV